ncbi:MAG: DUF4080 domain-containing protein [Bdellovibrionaceae bacterium]|nr:DUF4080 domain-containing protein [Pseudobdellovibrionaceae bacterium]
MSSSILLCALNSTYQHAAFGLRYLRANLQELKEQSQIIEYTISQSPLEIVEKILLLKPKIIGFGVYIWNTDEVFKVIRYLKQLSPEITIVLGGPEISYETEGQPHTQFCDYILKGEADFSFYKLCHDILSNQPLDHWKKITSSSLPDIKAIQLPYDLYTDEDIQNRVLYVEASRGCPYKCEYCLSSLDTSVRNFSIDPFLAEMQKLIDRGAKQFKFVDRTFNLSPTISESILVFFLKQIDKELFLHFEMVPDRLPDNLKDLIKQFPEGSLQFEIGIQTLNDTVGSLISRRQNVSKMKENFYFLRHHTKVHTHADLIVGLPAESLASFKTGFDQLIEWDPDEIQVGILKRLKGTPIVRHQSKFEMVYSDNTPFQIIKTKDLSFQDLQDMNRFSRFWDMIANSGQFGLTMKFLKSSAQAENRSFFDLFFHLSQFLFRRHKGTFAISLINLMESVFIYLKDELQMDSKEAAHLIYRDFCTRKKRDVPNYLKPYLDQKMNTMDTPLHPSHSTDKKASTDSLRKRQTNHSTYTSSLT